MSGQTDCVKTLALGRQFLIGSLYNYIEDVIIPNVKLWDPLDVSQSVVVKNETKRTVNVYKTSTTNQNDEDVNEQENEPTLIDLGMDDHSAMSVTAGLIRPTGAWQYVEQQTDAQGVTIHCRCSSKKMSVNPTELEVICRPEKLIKSQATHVVMAVTYGLESFCIFPFQHQLNDLANDGSESVNKTMNYAQIFADGLLTEREQLEPYQDEETDEEEDCCRIIPLDLNCIFFSDWLKITNKHGPSWTLLPVKEQYQACKKVLDHQVNKAVPLKIWLYPLEKLMAIVNLTKFNTDVRQDLVIRYHLLVKQWDRILIKTSSLVNMLDTFSNDWLPSTILRRVTNFRECIKQFLDILVEILGKWTVSVRRGDDLPQKNMDAIVKAIKYKSPFFPKEIHSWLEHQRQQIKTLELLANLPNVRLVNEVEKLETQIKSGGEDSFSVVLYLPSLKEKSDELVEEMKSYIKAQVSSWRRRKKNANQLLKTPANRRQIFNSGQEFSSWVTEHNNETTNVNYIIFYEEELGVGQNNPFIRLYNGSGEVICPSFSIPKAPEEIKIESNRRGIVTLSWVDENKIDQSSYLVQYRRADSPEIDWESIQESNHSTVFNHLKSDESYVFRVAVVTPGGRSPFSPITQKVTVDPVCPAPHGLRLRYATDESLTIDWNHQIYEDVYNNDDQSRYNDGDFYGQNDQIGDDEEEEYYEEREYLEDDDYYDEDDLVSNNDEEIYGQNDQLRDEQQEEYYENDEEQVYSEDDGRQMTNQRKEKENIQITSYSIECWKDGNNQDSTLIQRTSKEKTITLEPLELNTTYCIQIRAVCIDSMGSILYSPDSQILKTSTLKEPERAAIVIRHISKKISSSDDEMDTFQLPLKKHETTTPGIGHYVFGEPSYLSLAGSRRQRTVLILGATGSGKSTLINAMVNYILGVEWDDDFRFKLIDEPTDKSQADSQTDLVTTYNLYEVKGSRLNYSLTLVDTPGFGDTRGIVKDKMIMEQIRDYFKSQQGIQQLEAVCFVVQSSLPRLTPTQQYIFDSVLSIFGQDIKENIRLMVTFADISVPPVLWAVKEAGIPSPIDPITSLPLHHKFNNSIFITSNKIDRKTNEFNRTYFDLAVEGFEQFFNDLRLMESKSLTLTREVLDERKRLEALVEGLHIRTQMKLTRVDELEQIKKKLEENHTQIEANKNFEFEVEFLVPKSTDISGTGQFTTNCQKCRTTCHFPCRQSSDEDKHQCSVMDPVSNNCMICKCPWSNHFNQKFRYEMVMEKVKRSSDAILQQYQTATTQLLTNEDLLKSVENDIKEQEKQLVELMKATYPHIQRLDEIALRPHPFSAPDYIDLMITAEKQEHRQGYQQRIVTLQKLRQTAEILTKLIRENSKTFQTKVPVSKPQLPAASTTSTTGNNVFSNLFSTISRAFKTKENI